MCILLQLLYIFNKCQKTRLILTQEAFLVKSLVFSLNWHPPIGQLIFIPFLLAGRVSNCTSEIVLVAVTQRSLALHYFRWVTTFQWRLHIIITSDSAGVWFLYDSTATSDRQSSTFVFLSHWPCDRSISQWRSQHCGRSHSHWEGQRKPQPGHLVPFLETLST